MTNLEFLAAIVFVFASIWLKLKGVDLCIHQKKFQNASHIKFATSNLVLVKPQAIYWSTIFISLRNRIIGKNIYYRTLCLLGFKSWLYMYLLCDFEPVNIFLFQLLHLWSGVNHSPYFLGLL